MASTTSSRPFKVLSTLLIFLTTLSRFVTAATVLDSSKLPSCYSQCGPLTQANGACVPPAAPQTDQGTYQSCFCASTFLVQLYSTPTLSNCNACGTSDLTKIQSWYTNLCHGGVIVTPAAAAATATRTTTASTTTGTASSQTSGSSSRKSSQNNGGWFSNHWKWVVLLIVLVLAFVFFLVGGFWLKRRLRRRRDVQRFSGTGALRTANSPSPFASGVLAPSDGAYMGSRNHPPMSAVPGAGSAAAMERYGSGTHIPPHTGYSSERSPDYAVPSPPPGTATRNLPWMSRNNSGESGRSQRSKRERPGANTLDSPVSPVEGPDEIFPVVGGGKEKDLEEGGIKKKLSRKSRR